MNRLFLLVVFAVTSGVVTYESPVASQQVEAQTKKSTYVGSATVSGGGAAVFCESR